MLVLGIETSCDETAASVVEDGRWVRSDVVASQILTHQPYGGVVPEVASRQHVATIVPVVRQAVAAASMSLADLDGIAVTAALAWSGRCWSASRPPSRWPTRSKSRSSA